MWNSILKLNSVVAFGAVLSVAGNLVTADQAVAQGKSVSIDMGTIFVGSSWYRYGAAMQGLMKAQLPAGSTVTVRPYAGAFGNIKLLNKNQKIQLATTFNAAANWGYNGVVAFKGGKATNIRAIVGALDQYYLIVMARPGSGITDLHQIKQKKMKVNVTQNPPGGLAHYGTWLVLNAYGLTEDLIKKWGGSVNKVTMSASISAMKDRRADIWIHPVTAGHPAVTELTQTTKVNFLSLDPKVAGKLNKIGLPSIQLPANTFKGQNKPASVVGMSTILIVSKEMDDKVAYSLTKAVIGNAKSLKSQIKAFKKFNPKTTWKSQYTGGVPLHPGAAKYYKEAGLM